jgi:hypothetical protein
LLCDYLDVRRRVARRVTRLEARRFATVGSPAVFFARLRAGALLAVARFLVVRFVARLRAGARLAVARFLVARFFVVRFVARLRAGARFAVARFLVDFLALLTGIVDALLTAFWPIA